MSRDLKFRAWNLIQKRWENKLGLYFDDGKVGDFSEAFHNEEDSENYVVQQFTGRFDNYGSAIYEGDILRLGNNNLKAEVAYSLEEFCYICKYLGGSFVYLPDFKNVEVIGNIFENPNLLNETD